MKSILSSDQTFLWIEDPITDIINMGRDVWDSSEVCKPKCKINRCKVQCNDYCGVMIKD